MPADTKRSQKSSSDIVKNKKKRTAGTKEGKTKASKGISKTRKRLEEKKVTRARGKVGEKAKKNGKKSVRDNTSTTAVEASSDDDGSKSKAVSTAQKKKSSQQQRKEFNQAASVSTLSLPMSKMMKAFKFFYVQHRSKLSGVPQKAKTIQMESDIKYCLNDLVNHAIKQSIGVSKCFSALKNKPTIEASDISASSFLLGNYGENRMSFV
jgi:hypothetical protein